MNKFLRHSVNMQSWLQNQQLCFLGSALPQYVLICPIVRKLSFHFFLTTYHNIIREGFKIIINIFSNKVRMIRNILKSNKSVHNLQHFVFESRFGGGEGGFSN